MDYLVKSAIFAFLIMEIVGRYIEKSPSDCRCDWRYYKHYEIKGCQLQKTNSCGCPVNYLCPSVNESLSTLNVCVYQNVEYQLGARIKLEDNCKVCKCVQGRVVCRDRECPQLDSVEGRNCHLVYEEGKCCPKRYECTRELTNENFAESTEFSCVFNNVTYPLGAKIYPPEDPCQVCECTSDWNGISNTSCHQQECVQERYKYYLTAGCVPVYHETKCCPIEFHCPKRYNSVPHDIEMTRNIEEEYAEMTEHHEQCLFEGNYYDIGSELLTNKSCIKCTCRVPPLFTCIHQSCSTPPNVENCFVDYTEDECCPEYDCRTGDVDAERDGYANDTTSTAGLEIDCPTPVCEDGSCYVGIPEGFTCPTCICKDSPERNDLEPAEETYQPFTTGNGTLSFNDSVPSSEETYNPKEKEPLSQSFSENLLENSESTHYEGGDVEPKVFQEQNETGENFLLHNTSRIATSETDENVQPYGKRQRRSENTPEATSSNSQVQWNILQQDQLIPDSSDYAENTDREHEDLDESNEGFDEMTAFGSRSRMATDNIVELDDTDYENVNWETIVPGCPSPLCENSSCRIGVPQGQKCPTCICKRHRQP